MIIAYVKVGVSLHQSVKEAKAMSGDKTRWELLVIHYERRHTQVRITIQGGQVVSASACQAGGLWFKSGILPLLKHTCGESNWLLCWLYTLTEVSHQRWISGNVYNVCLCKVRIRQHPLWLWNPEETSPELLFTISGDTNRWELIVNHYDRRHKQVRVTSDSLWQKT